MAYLYLLPLVRGIRMDGSCAESSSLYCESGKLETLDIFTYHGHRVIFLLF